MSVITACKPCVSRGLSIVTFPAFPGLSHFSVQAMPLLPRPSNGRLLAQSFRGGPQSSRALSVSIQSRSPNWGGIRRSAVRGGKFSDRGKDLANSPQAQCRTSARLQSPSYNNSRDARSTRRRREYPTATGSTASVEVRRGRRRDYKVKDGGVGRWEDVCRPKITCGRRYRGVTGS